MKPPPDPCAVASAPDRASAERRSIVADAEAGLRRFVDALQVLAGDIALQPANVERDLQLLKDLWPDASFRDMPSLREVLIETACRLELLTGPDPPRCSFVTVIRELAKGDSSGATRDDFAVFALFVSAHLHQRERAGADVRVASALAAVDAECGNPLLRLEDVSAAVRMSKWHLTRLLQQHTGHGFSWHVRLARLSRALELLDRSMLTMKEVASAVGYSSATQFGRQFKQYCGMTPREWRARNR